VGVGNVTPSYTLHVQSSSEQLRLQVDAANYAGFTVDAGGQLTVRAKNNVVIDTGGGTDACLFINETEHANMTMGICINMGSALDEAFDIKQAGVAHGATDIAETDTYAVMRMAQNNVGGLNIQGLRESGGNAYDALKLDGYQALNADTTKSTSGQAIVGVYGYQTSGTSLADTVADGNVFSVHTQRSSSTVTLFIVDEDGDLHADGSFDNVYDEEDDALAVAELAQGLAQNWNDTLAYNFDKLRAMGVISGGTPDRPFISWKNLNALYMGAIAQLYQRVNLLTGEA